MLIKTRGIVLHQVRYGDTSLIITLLTEETGLQSVIAKSVRSPKAKIRASIFQNMSVIDLTAYHKSTGTLDIVREAKIGRIFHSISPDIRKTMILMFMNELIYKSVHHGEANPGMFRFVIQALEELDTRQSEFSLFPLIFMIRLSGQLGFSPLNNYSPQNCLFLLREGAFTQSQNQSPEMTIREPESGYFSRLLAAENEPAGLGIPKDVIQALVEKMIAYFWQHIPEFGEFKSLEVLRSLSAI